MKTINKDFATKIFQSALNEIENAPSTEVTDNHQKFYNMLEKNPGLYKIACDNVFRIIRSRKRKITIEGKTTIDGKITIE